MIDFYLTSALDTLTVSADDLDEKTWLMFGLAVLRVVGICEHAAYSIHLV